MIPLCSHQLSSLVRIVRKPTRIPLSSLPIAGISPPHDQLQTNFLATVDCCRQREFLPPKADGTSPSFLLNLFTPSSPGNFYKGPAPLFYDFEGISVALGSFDTSVLPRRIPKVPFFFPVRQSLTPRMARLQSGMIRSASPKCRAGFSP